jgi:hypothetical protein
MRTVLLTALAAALVSGCMFTPTDGQVVAATGAPVVFSGMLLGPDEPVTVRAFDVRARGWGAVATTASSTQSTPLGTAALYPWSATATLEPRFWLAGFPTGFGARVQADTGSVPLLSVGPDWVSCGRSHPDPGGFAAHCASGHAPVAWIGTADFAPPVVRTLEVRRHTSAQITEAEADRILSDASVVLQELDTADLRCGEELQRKTALSVFTTGDGSIDSDVDFRAIRDLPGEVMIVNDINWCGGLVPNVVGCASGDSFAAVRLGSSLEGILWAHEHGHNRGLPHRVSDYAVMNPSLRTTARGVNGQECGAYVGSPS